MAGCRPLSSHLVSAFRRRPPVFLIVRYGSVVPFAPGGGVDIITRLVTPKLSAMWGQPVIVENKPGAIGAIASEYVLQQPADGYTIMVGVAGTHAIAKSLNPNLGFDPIERLRQHHVDVEVLPLICLVAPSSPFHTIKELVDDARTHPVPFGSPGVGSANASDWRDVQPALRHAIPARRLSRRRTARPCSGSDRRAYSDGDGRNGVVETAFVTSGRRIAGTGGDQELNAIQAFPTCRSFTEAGSSELRRQ